MYVCVRVRVRVRVRVHVRVCVCVHVCVCVCVCVWKVDRVQKESCTFEMLAPQTMRRKNCGKRGASKSRNVPMSFMMSAPSLQRQYAWTEGHVCNQEKYLPYWIAHY